MRKRIKIRFVGLGCILFILFIIVLKPAWHLGKVALSDKDTRKQEPSGYVNDASRLNSTAMKQVIPPGENFHETLRELLAKAHAEGLRVSVAGARHTMGGHTIYPGGVALDMQNYNHMEMEGTEILKVGSGARWKEVIPFLDQQGLSVAVMQSNDSFSVGGSISVNCHGWQWNAPPISSSVASFTIMLADGSVKNCSPQENTLLYSTALGGYGLIGVILDVRLRVVKNEQLRKNRYVINTSDCEKTFAKISGENPVMGFGRIAVRKDMFLGKMIWNTYVPSEDPLSEIGERGLTDLKRAIFRGSEGSNYGKELRWEAELRLEPAVSPPSVSRNHLLSEGVELYENRSANTTDILHEYFVPVEQSEEFINGVKTRIGDTDLLNMTVRYVKKDNNTMLSYATQDMLAFVLLFSQEVSDSAETQMQDTTKKLIDLALSLNGRYYLPYRLHATPQQFRKAYPMYEKFHAVKKKYDEAEVFNNTFYQKYFSH